MALVLSGGGARGAAHVGVLRVLEEAHVPVDWVVGTSMGSIVGGLYSVGLGPDEIEAALVDTNWERVFVDRPPRAERYFRRKQENADFLVQYHLDFKQGKPQLPLGLLQAQKLENLLKYYEVLWAAGSDFDRFQIPYRAVATDLANGEAVVIDHGSLATAMRASLSIPGLFPPVPLDGKLLIDGGVVANLPVEIARGFDPDIVIAVDISTPLEGRDDPTSSLEVVKRLTGFLTHGNVARSIAGLRDGDILIVPALGDLGAKDFPRAEEAIAIGEQAAREVLGRLKELSVSEDVWSDWIGHHRVEKPEPPRIAAVHLTNESPVRDELILARLRIREGEPLDIVRLSEDMSRLYGLGYFEPISFEVTGGESGAELNLHLRERATGLTTMRFGLTLEDDFEGGDSYELGIRLERLAANRRGGEWRTDLRLGDRSRASAEFYQPLDAGMRWFVSPAATFEQRRQLLLSQGRRLAEVLITDYGVDVALGRNLGDWGEMRVELERGRERLKVQIPEDLVGTLSQEYAGGAVRLAVDTLDAPDWPRSGVLGSLDYETTARVVGGETESADLTLRGNYAFTVGHTTFLPGVEATWDLGSANAEPGDKRTVFLGGAFRLSGFEPDELLGQELVLGRLVVMHELGHRAFRIFRPGWYIGASLEAGNVFDAPDSISTSDLLYGGTLFVAADTVFGPVQVGWGIGSGDRSRFYLSVGRRFF
ncbi:MAG: patatin-like phospholipase family protein [Thermoanaerobaculia bacterium]